MTDKKDDNKEKLNKETINKEKPVKEKSDNEKTPEKSSKRPSKAARFFKNKIFITVAIIVAVLAAASPVAYKYYQDYMNAPNFENPEINYINVSSDKAVPGDEIQYQINIKNEGRRSVSDISIVTDIPQYSTIASEDIEYVEKIDTENGKIYFSIDKLEVGQSLALSYDVVIDNPLDNGTVIGNSTFSIDYRKETLEGIFSKAFDTNLSTIVESFTNFDQSSYKVKDENGDYIRMGDTLKVTFSIKNTGDMNAKNIMLENLVPENTSFVDGSFSSGKAKLNNSQDKLSITIDQLDAGKNISFNYSLTVNPGLVDMTDLIFEPYIANNPEQIQLESQKHTVRAFPDISEFTLSSSDENGGDLQSNDTLLYVVKIKNTGDGVANNITIDNPIPANTSFMESNLDPANILSGPSGGTIKVNIDALEPGDGEIVYSYRVRVNGGLSIGTRISNTCSLVIDEEKITSNSVANTVVANFAYNVVVIGDSQVAYTNWVGYLKSIMESRYPYGDFNFSKYGVGGETVVRGYNRMLSQGLLGTNPYIFVINYGTNDASGIHGYYTSKETFGHYLSTMIDTVQANTGAMVVVMSTGPSNDPDHSNSRLASLNNIMANICNQKGAVFVDVFNPMIQTGNIGQFLSDGLHYNGNGDQFVGNIAFSRISQYLNAYGTR